MPITTPEFDANKNQIRAFCHRATHTGGVLLVAGIRGVGKTRLVDEALNERNEQGTSRRVEIIREPRQVPRYLIKVDVDPFFPTEQKPKNEGSADNHSIDENALAFTLMKNIVFALTSTIDSRYSLRKHGKTLRQRLGFRRYWFASNGISSSSKLKEKLLVLWSSSTLIMFAVLAVTFASLLKDEDCLLIFLLNLFVFCSAFNVVLISIGTMFWRWRDWRALATMSEYLFALVNAHEMSKTNDTNISTKQEWVSKLPSFLFLFLAATVTYSVLTDSFQSVFGFLSKYKPAVALLFASISYSTIKSTETKKLNHAQYDQTNAAWMISLLRRYQFLCHQCGLEPVLVFDELDKLEELNDFWIECKSSREKKYLEAYPPKQSSIFRAANTQQQPMSNNKLDMFLVALSRLKSSLGAEFLWVLISGPKLSEHLQKHRHNRQDDSLGILATVITQEVIVGAV